MLSNQFILPMAAELVVDLFAGGGGASTGIEQAIGRHVDIAVNHDPEAVSLHQVNHPQTQHFVSDVFEVDPHAVCGNSVCPPLAKAIVTANFKEATALEIAA